MLMTLAETLQLRLNMIFIHTKYDSMKQVKYLLFAMIVVGSTVFQACNNDDPEPENEEELITTVTVTLVPEGGGSNVVLRFSDPDGDGGDPPVITGGTLSVSERYEGSIELLNESVTPAEDITEEIEEEADEHIFCYTPSNGLPLSINRTDSDGTFEIGLETEWIPATSGEGTVRVVLKHQPGVKDGGCDNGDTDIEIDFPITIE